MGKIRRLIGPLAVMLLIFLFSQQSGEISHAISDWCGDVLNYIFGGKLEYPDSSEPLFLGLSLRKFAHLVLYALLGAMMYRAVSGVYWQGRRVAWLLTLLVCFLYACVDEFHQFFVPGRAFHLRDIGIDMIGSVVGMMVVRGMFKREK